MRLKGKVAIITGASSGIGKAIALRFAKEGASVVIAARNDDGKKVEKEIVNKGGKALFVKTDVSNSNSVKQMVEKAMKHFKKINILVNNAGILEFGNAESTSEEDWERTINTNLKSVFLCVKHVVPHMKNKNASIINIGSELGLFGGREVVAYCASKGGVVNVTRAMALDYARQGIRVNCVCPGPINTKMLGILTKKELELIANLVPMGRLGKPEEVANLVLFLASDEASYVTGSIHSVDGGYSAGSYV